MTGKACLREDGPDIAREIRGGWGGFSQETRPQHWNDDGSHHGMVERITTQRGVKGGTERQEAAGQESCGGMCERA